jgi:DNA-binding MarR family transcriptional regulator
VIERLSIAFLTWRRYLQRQIAAHGITLKQSFVLRQLVKQDDLLPSEVARMLFCDRPTATVIVKNLEKQGWVQRRRDEQDRRRTRITITPAGRTKHAELAVTWRAIESGFDPLACFDEGEVTELERLLGVLNEHLEQIRQEP